jgi:hypothetical protein
MGRSIRRLEPDFPIAYPGVAPGEFPARILAFCFPSKSAIADPAASEIAYDLIFGPQLLTPAQNHAAQGICNCSHCLPIKSIPIFPVSNPEHTEKKNKFIPSRLHLKKPAV